MSFQAMAWASTVTPERASEKFLLLMMANWADDRWLCFPSIDTLSTATLMDRKTIITRLESLQRQGFIEDTGQRIGQTKQIVVYRLRVPKTGLLKSPVFPGNSTVFPGNSPKNGTRTLSVHSQRDSVGQSVQKNRSTRGPRLVLEQDLLDLQKDPAYRLIAVRQEHGKASKWCEAHNKVLTYRRFINWLNRAEPVKANGKHYMDKDTEQTVAKASRLLADTEQPSAGPSVDVSGLFGKEKP